MIRKRRFEKIKATNTKILLLAFLTMICLSNLIFAHDQGRDTDIYNVDIDNNILSTFKICETDHENCLFKIIDFNDIATLADPEQIIQLLQQTNICEKWHEEIENWFIEHGHGSRSQGIKWTHPSNLHATPYPNRVELEWSPVFPHCQMSLEYANGLVAIFGEFIGISTLWDLIKEFAGMQWGISGYRVFRAEGEDEPTLIHTYIVPDLPPLWVLWLLEIFGITFHPSFTDFNVEHGSTYTYFVKPICRPFVHEGCNPAPPHTGSESNHVTLVVEDSINPPQNLQVDVLAHDSLYITWEAPATGTVTHYELIRSGVRVGGNITTTQFTDTDGPYFNPVYRVRAALSNPQGFSGWSNPVRVEEWATPQRPSNWDTPFAGTQSNPYLINDLNNLRWLSERGIDWYIDANTQVHFKQTADIYALESIYWNNGNGFLPIGHGETAAAASFIGVYDGDGFIIQSLFINNAFGLENVGMFNTLSNSTIKNLNLEHINIAGTNANTGAVAGQAINNSSLENINTSGFLSGLYAGGIVGALLNSTITNCSSSISPQRLSNSYIGGIASWAVNSIIDGSSSSASVEIVNASDTIGNTQTLGGIVADIENSTISNSFSTGNFSTGSRPIGGIVATARNNSLIENCYSTGSVSTSGFFVLGEAGGIAGTLSDSNVINSRSSGNIFASSAGGIVGESTGSSFVGNSFSTGDITGEKVGGIVGSATNLQVSSCYSTGTINFTGGLLLDGAGGIVGYASSSYFNHNYSTGLISAGTSQVAHVGGIAGLSYSSTFFGCYFTGSIQGRNGVGGIVGDANSYTWIRDCYSTGSIAGNRRIGGIAGRLQTNSSVSDCFVFGNVLGDGNSVFAGGIAGEVLTNSTVAFSYMAGNMNNQRSGALVGRINDGTTINSFWDFESSGVSFAFFEQNGSNTIQDNHGRNSATMKTSSNYINNNWDFEWVWTIDTDLNNGYPFLKTIPVTTPSTFFGPRNLTKSFNNGAVTLTWEAPLSGNVTEYRVFRNGVMVANLNNLVFTDQDVPLDNYYFYGVRAIYSNGESGTAEIIVNLLLNNPPTQLYATIGNAIVTLSWEAPVFDTPQNLIGYAIYRNNVQLIEIDDILTYTDTGLINGTTYNYYVTALYTNPNGESAASNTVLATPRFIITEFPYIQDFSITPPVFWTRATGFLTSLFVLDPISSTNWNNLRHWTIGNFLNNSSHQNGSAARFQFWYESESWGTITPSRYWLISPEIVLTEGNDYVLSFDIALESNVGANDIFAVVLAIDGILWSSDYTLARWDNSGSYRSLNQISRTGENISITIPSQYTGTIKIGFYGEARGLNFNYLYVDNVRLEQNSSNDNDIVTIPNKTELLPNYPNPFNPETNIRFNTTKAGYVKIDVYNIRGQKVKTLLNEYVGIGNHNVVWNGTNDNGQNVSSGVYLYRLQTDDFTSTRRMVLLK
ncbi:MAG: T9SS type A sorting domain-containing protein [Candidatus Cloacimonetes bacterium]|nr:T9SS type A sorting domain-containing protein [Candidatus Cloacimonadota bacterium]